MICKGVQPPKLGSRARPHPSVHKGGRLAGRAAGLVCLKPRTVTILLPLQISKPPQRELTPPKLADRDFVSKKLPKNEMDASG